MVALDWLSMSPAPVRTPSNVQLPVINMASAVHIMCELLGKLA